MYSKSSATWATESLISGELHRLLLSVRSEPVTYFLTMEISYSVVFINFILQTNKFYAPIYVKQNEVM